MISSNRRYGDPTILQAYTVGMSIESIARELNRHPRTIRDWMNGKRRTPWWAIELLRLHRRHGPYLQDASVSIER